MVKRLTTFIERARGPLLLSASAVSLAMLLVAFDVIGMQSQTTDPVSQAVFQTDGSVRLPVRYVQWVHVGTRIKVGGLNILDGTKLAVPQVLNAYVEPTALNYYKRTGKWADGSQIVKVITSIKVGNDCDPATYECKTPLGLGLFEETYVGIGMMVKDSKRFPSDPGNWGYFAFLRKGASYEATSTKRPLQQCASCHVNLASDTDYVITKAHLGLSTASMQ
jgi:hypothetical protein